MNRSVQLKYYGFSVIGNKSFDDNNALYSVENDWVSSVTTLIYNIRWKAKQIPKMLKHEIDGDLWPS